MSRKHFVIVTGAWLIIAPTIFFVESCGEKQDSQEAVREQQGPPAPEKKPSSIPVPAELLGRHSDSLRVRFVDVFGGRGPSAPRELWPAVPPLAAGEKHHNELKGRKDAAEGEFQLWIVGANHGQPATVMDVMRAATKMGLFVADPYQVKQFDEFPLGKLSDWSASDGVGTVAVSREFRYLDLGGGVVPPVVYFFSSGQWREASGDPIILPGTFVLLMKQLEKPAPPMDAATKKMCEAFRRWRMEEADAYDRDNAGMLRDAERKLAAAIREYHRPLPESCCDPIIMFTNIEEVVSRKELVAMMEWGLTRGQKQREIDVEFYPRLTIAELVKIGVLPDKGYKYEKDLKEYLSKKGDR